MSDGAAVPAGPRQMPKIWLLNPYFLIIVGALLDTTGELLLSKGAKLAAPTAASLGVFSWIAPLYYAWTWLGIISYVTSMLTWLYVLRFVPLSIAFPLISVVQVLVPTCVHLFLHEAIPPRLWIGVALICMGVLVIARPLMKAEDKL